ncbi:MAG: DUF3562 domain-containing protein [Sulfuricaulis sp.]
MKQPLYDESEVESSRHRDTIDHLAKESGLPASEIFRIYEAELQRLKTDAKVKDFLPVLLIRIVRDTIRQRINH